MTSSNCQKKRRSVPRVDFAGRGQNVFKEDVVDQ